eukprot:1921272-Pyramimonas_sp.AAC.1
MPRGTARRSAEATSKASKRSAASTSASSTVARGVRPRRYVRSAQAWPSKTTSRATAQRWWEKRMDLE